MIAAFLLTLLMTPNKPYLIRALYEWLVDNQATPHIMVDASRPGVEIPPGIANEQGQVVLNIAERAVQGLQMDNAYIAFSARFSGVSQQLFIPIEAVMAIYSMEDGEGMMFADTPTPESDASEAPQNDAGKAENKVEKKGPGLKIVK
jgi:stringent starvation protein B